MSGSNPLLTPGAQPGASALGPAPAAAAPPTPFQTQQSEETAGGPKHDYRQITHQHVLNGTRHLSHENALQKRDQVGGVIDTLTALAQKPDLTRKDISAEIAAKMQTGDMTPDEAITTLNSLPTDDKDPKALKNWVMLHLRSAIGLAVHLHSAYPEEVFPRGGGSPVGAAPPGAPPAPGGPPQAANNIPGNMPGGTP